MASIAIITKIIHVSYSHDGDSLGEPDISEFVYSNNNSYVKRLGCMESDPPIYVYEVDEKYHQFFIEKLKNKNYIVHLKNRSKK